MATPRPRKDTALVPKTMRYRASYFSDHRFLFASAATKIPPPRGTTVVSDRGPPAMPDNIGDIHPSPPPSLPPPCWPPWLALVPRKSGIFCVFRKSVRCRDIGFVTVAETGRE